MKRGIVTNAKDWYSKQLQSRMKWFGMHLSIENDRGSIRAGTDKDGHTWRTFMHIPYGYIRLTEGVDGDHVDCYIGPHPHSDKVFIVHQNDPNTGKYDEDKVMLGFERYAEAKAAYIRQYDRPGFFGSMDTYDIATFKEMLKERKGMKLKKSHDLIKAKRMAIGTVVTRGGESYRKVAEKKWVRVPKKEAQAKKEAYQRVYNKVSKAIRSIKEREYVKDLTRGGDKLYRAQYEALKNEFPNLPITYKRYTQLVLRKDIKTGMDLWDAVTDEMMKKLKKSRGKKDPIGTIRNGRKKVAEGKWVPVRDNQEEPIPEPDLKKKGVPKGFKKVAFSQWKGQGLGETGADFEYKGFLIQNTGSRWIILKDSKVVYRTDYGDMARYWIDKRSKLRKAVMKIPDLTLLKSDRGDWYLYENGGLYPFTWVRLEKATRAKQYYSKEEIQARGMRWVTINGARVLLQGTSDGGYVVVGGAGGRLNHLKVDKVVGKEEYKQKRKEKEKRRKEELEKLTPEEVAEQARARKEEIKQKRGLRKQYNEKVAEILGVTREEMRAEITANEMDELTERARQMVEGRAKSKTLDEEALNKQVEDQAAKEVEKETQKKIKNIERQALEYLMNDYAPDDPNLKPEMKKLLDKDKAMDVLKARKEFRKQMREIGKTQADPHTDLRVGDVFAGASKYSDEEIQKEIEDQIETAKNIKLYDTLNAQNLTIQKHIDQGSISALNGLLGDLYGVGATFSEETVEQLGLEAVVRAVAIKIQEDGKGSIVQKALEEYAATEREKVVSRALEESELRFKNAEELRNLARDTDDAEAILSMASANGHALKQLTAGQRALGTAVGSLRAVAHMISALDDPPGDVVQVDMGKDLARARKKAKKAGLPRGSYSIKTKKQGRGKRLVLEIPKENLDTFFARNEELRKDESELARIKSGKANNGYKPPGIKDSITLTDSQERGLRFFMEQGRVLLDFEAGLGKTGLGYACAMEAMKNKGAKKVLVVAPAGPRDDFYNQRETFLNEEDQKNVRLAHENTPAKTRKGFYEKDGITIVSHDAMRLDAEEIKAAGFDMVIMDEIHEVTAGSGNAQRFKSMNDSLKDVPYKIGMSGTNIKSSKKELYRKIQFLDPDHTLGSMSDFERRYKGLNQGTGIFADAANEAFRKELGNWMFTQKNFFPVENNQETIRVPLTPEQRRQYAESERIYRDERERKVPGASGHRDSRNYSIISNGDAANNNKANELVRLMNEKHPGEKAVIHLSRPGAPVKKAIRTLTKRLESEYGEGCCATIDGSTGRKAEELKRRFNDPADPLRFLIGTKTLESGHNLQAGGTVNFHMDIPDSYAAKSQREARTYRKGQTKDTHSYLLSGNNPYDMSAEDNLGRKEKESGILGNPREVEAMDDTGFIGLLNKYEREAQGGRSEESAA